MIGLPYQTHRGLIEPITGRKHQRTCFIKRFMVLKRLLSEIKFGVLSTTRRNLRNIMLETSKSSVREVIRYQQSYVFLSWRGRRMEGWDAEVLAGGGAKASAGQWRRRMAGVFVYWLILFINILFILMFLSLVTRKLNKPIK